ncbi:ECF-type sigma factor [Piscinibacter sakaiensis]|uniref:Gll4071 protein n=1 Tax=Piscinibacter sakaiensis TaxID=1547922 RepID=A0A0K8P0C2_PISS1|nr:ECF-type sigma factor [Piscinibacter sakaiensis]GAP35989.1 Gll4071 protein [Piscinibacter sakaiensis]
MSAFATPTAVTAGQGVDPLFATLYAELHRIARREVRRQGESSPVSATTLLHEAYLDMSRRDALAFPDEGRFLAYASRAMRGLVIDRVRQRQAAKRGGGLDLTALDTQIAEDCSAPEGLVALGDALQSLEALDPALAQIVDLRFFCGLSLAELAPLLGLSERTAQRRWEKARLLLAQSLGEPAGG